MKDFIKKHKELFIGILIILIIIMFQVKTFIVNQNYNSDKITIEEINQYGEKIIKEDLLPNTIIAKIDGEKIYKYEIDKYQYSLDYSQQTEKNALYEVIKNKIIIRYADTDYFENRQELYQGTVEEIKEMTDKEFQELLKIYGISQQEKWISDSELKNIMLEQSLEMYLYSSGYSKILENCLVNEDYLMDSTYLEKVEQYNNLKASNNGVEQVELLEEIQNIYIEQLILRSNIEFCSYVEERVIINTTKEYTEEEKIISMQKGNNFVKLGNVAVYANDFDEYIYIFNTEDKSYKKLYHSEDGIDKIYFDGEYIYLLPSYYRGKGIIKIDLLGNAEKIYEGASLQLWIEDEKIYFVDQIGYDKINGTPQGNLCVMNKKGSNKQIIIENVKNYFQIVDNYIYYIDQSSRSVYRANIDGTNKKELAKGRNYITSATEKYLTYLDYNDGQKHKIIYLNNNKIDEIGRFGSVYSLNDNLYFYTKQVIDSNNKVENNFSLFKADISNQFLTKSWTAGENSFEYLYYVYNGYGYFRKGSDFYKVNLTNYEDNEKMDFGYSYFIDGKVYAVKRNNGDVTELYIYDLDEI